MTTAAAVWVDVLPSMKNFGGDLVRQVSESAGKAGDKAGDEMGERTKSGFSAHVGKIAAVGAVVGTALIGALSASMDASSANAKLAAQLGLTPPEAQRYGKLAGDLYSQAYGESLTQVNDALGAVRTNISGMATASDADLQSVTKTVLDLSSGLGLDLTESTRAVGTMMRTGMAPDAKSAMDIIVAGMQNGVNASGDLLDTFNEYSTQFRKLGLDGATATGILQQGLKGGARDADLVADAMKEFSIRSVDGSKASAAGFQALGLDAQKMTSQIAQGGPAASAGLDMVLDRLRGMKDPVAQSQAAVALFGTQAEDLGAALLTIDPSSAVDGLGQVAGASDRFGATLNDTTASRIESFKRGLQTNVTDFVGNVLIPGLSTAADFVSTVFGPVWSAVGPVIAPIAPYLVATGAGLGAVVLAGKGLGAVKSGLTDARDMVVGVKDAITGTPEKVRQLGSAWDTVKSGASTAGSALSTAGGWIADTGRKSLDAAKNLGSLALDYGRAGVAAMISGGRQVGAAVATGVVTAATWAWSAAQAALNFVMSLSPMTWLIIGIVALVAAVIYAYNNFAWFREGVAAAWSGIQVAASWAWGILQTIFGAIVAGTQAVGSFFVWLWQSAVVPAWSGIQAAASFAWNSIIRPAFDGLMSGVRAVGDAFGWAVDRIRDVWARIQDIVRPPIEFVVNTVYNGGIRPAWNFIADLFGLGQLPALTFATGGLVPGYRPGKDTVPAMLSPGEGVLVPEAVRMIGADTVLQLNRMARSGSSRSSAATMLGPRQGDLGNLDDYPFVQKFADGGIVGWIWDRVVDVGEFVGGVAEIIADPVGAIRNAFSAVAGGDGGIGGLFGQGIAALPIKAVDGVIGWMKTFVEENAPAGNLGAGLAWAKSQVGLPYTWGGAGNPGWDCSGFIAGITSIIRGETPRRIGTTATMPWPGFTRGASGPFTVGNSRNTGDGIGHMAGTLLGQNVESYGGHGPAVGSGARGSADGLFGEQYVFTADTGGRLPTGWSSVYNGTGRAEAILTGAQWNALAANVRGGDDGGEFVLTSGAIEILDDGLVRIVDGRVRRVLTATSNGRRA